MTPAGKILRSATILRHDLAIVTLPSPYSPCKLINRSFMQRALTTSYRSVGLYLASIATYGGKFLTMTWFERHCSCPEGIMPFLLICLHTWSSFCLLRGFYLDGCSSCLSSLKSFSFSASCSFPLPSTSFACSTAWAKALQIVSPKSKFWYKFWVNVIEASSKTDLSWSMQITCRAECSWKTRPTISEWHACNTTKSINYWFSLCLSKSLICSASTSSPSPVSLSRRR